MAGFVASFRGLGEAFGSGCAERLGFLLHALEAPALRAVEVGGQDRGYLDGWLSKRTGLKVVAPDLAGQGGPE